MGRAHLREIVGREDTVVAAICEPGATPTSWPPRRSRPPARRDRPTSPTGTLHRRHGPELELDAVMIVTPHALHFAQASAALEAGLDVLLEKPMVMNATEAVELIRTRDRTGRLLVVGFQGSLSPHVRAAAAMLRSGELGAILNVNALVWQDWHFWPAGTWRETPALSGGGFMFDTGAHMLNTVADLAGEDVAAGRGLARGRRQPGGRARRGHRPPRVRRADHDERLRAAIPSLGSDIRVYCERGTLRTGIWGERLELQRSGAKSLRAVRSVRPKSLWQQFLDVRAGLEPNPSPPEVGLRMARLWDAIRESSARGGAVVTPVREADAA